MARKHRGKREKLLVMSNFSFSHSVFKIMILQTCVNQGLFGKGLTNITMVQSSSNGKKTPWEMEKLLITSNFSISKSVFKRFVL